MDSIVAFRQPCWRLLCGQAAAGGVRLADCGFGLPAPASDVFCSLVCRLGLAPRPALPAVFGGFVSLACLPCFSVGSAACLLAAGLVDVGGTFGGRRAQRLVDGVRNVGDLGLRRRPSAARSQLY